MPNEIKNLHTVDKDSAPYIIETNAEIKLKDGSGIVRFNVFRPKAEGKYPVLATYGPYGKDIPYSMFVHNTPDWAFHLLTWLDSIHSPSQN